MYPPPYKDPHMDRKQWVEYLHRIQREGQVPTYFTYEIQSNGTGATTNHITSNPIQHKGPVLVYWQMAGFIASANLNANTTYLKRNGEVILTMDKCAWYGMWVIENVEHGDVLTITTNTAVVSEDVLMTIESL